MPTDAFHNFNVSSPCHSESLFYVKLGKKPCDRLFSYILRVSGITSTTGTHITITHSPDSIVNHFSNSTLKMFSFPPRHRVLIEEPDKVPSGSLQTG